MDLNPIVRAAVDSASAIGADIVQDIIGPGQREARRSALDGIGQSSSPFKYGQRYEDIHLPFMMELKNRDGSPFLFQGKSAPTLIFRVNPTSKELPLKKIITREMTRGAWVEFHGGDELDSISVNGASGTMFLDNGAIVNISEGRKDTPAKKFIDQLIELFRNNGNYYDNRALIYDTGKIVVSYDNKIYEGLFESLVVTESVDQPYMLTYSFSFIVTKLLMQLTRQISVNHAYFGSSL